MVLKFLYLYCDFTRKNPIYLLIYFLDMYISELRNVLFYIFSFSTGCDNGGGHRGNWFHTASYIGNSYIQLGSTSHSSCGCIWSWFRTLGYGVFILISICLQLTPVKRCVHLIIDCFIFSFCSSFWLLLMLIFDVVLIRWGLFLTKWTTT